MNDPLEDWRRQQDQIRRAMVSPLEAMTKSQRALDAALKDPMSDLLKSMEAQRKAFRSVADVVTEPQQALRQMVDSPVRQVLESQARLQRLLMNPLADLGRWQVQSALTESEPFRTLQQDLVAAMSVAGEEVEVERLDGWADDSPQGEWLESWKTGLAQWDPALEQVEELLGVLALIISLVLWRASGLPEETAEVLEPLGLLFAAGSLLIHFGRKTS